MIKKYFALSIIALSVALVGCSSDDDDDDPVAGGTTDGATTDGGSTDGGSTDGGSTDGGSTDGGSTDGGAAVALTAEATVPEVSAYDFVASSTDHTTLLAALNANPAIANAADDEAAPITLIAPNNAAFDALIAATDSSATADELLANEGELVTRTLQYHAIGSVVDITDTTPATDTLLVDDGTAAQLTFQAGTTETAAAVDSAATAVDLAVVSEAATGNLYSAASVLVAPDAPVVDGGSTDGGGTTGGGATAGAAGSIETLLGAQTASFDSSIAGVATAFGNAFNSAPWTLFLPDDTVATADLTEAATVGLAVSTAALDEAGLEALIGTNLQNANSSSVSGNTYVAEEIAVGGVSGALTFGGFAVTYIGQVTNDDGSTGAQVWSIASQLPDAVLVP